MNVLSLFDGCSMARQALHNLGIGPSHYMTVEIDKYAKQIGQKNWPASYTSCDDVREFNMEHLWFMSSVDLLIGGSPCQDLSIAGKKAGLNGERSSLFFEYLRILKETKPKYFVLENVASMKATDRDEISRHMGVEPVMIDAADFSAQQRKRLFWTNIPVLPRPKMLSKAVLADVLQDGYWCDRERKRLVFCIEGEHYKAGHIMQDGLADIKGREMIRRVYAPNGKAPTARANSGGNAEIKVLQVAGTDGKSDFNGYNRVFDPKGKSPTVTLSSSKGHYIKVALEDLKWRSLTPVEVERLMGLPDNYTEGVSRTQRYKMLGNGFSVPVIMHILKGMRLYRPNAQVR